MLNVDHFRNVHNRLGRPELISILKNHFLNDYKMENGKSPRFTNIRKDTQVLVYKDTAPTHFRMVMRTVWDSLVELFPCLPDEYSKVNLEVYILISQ